MKKKINQEESVDIKHFNPVFWNAKGITLSLLCLAIFFAFQQSGFGVLDYVPLPIWRLLQAIMIVSSVFLAFWFFLNRNTLLGLYKSILWGLVLINILYAFLGIIYKSDISLLFHIESIIFAFLSMIILSDLRIYIALLWIIFLTGVVLVILNMIPLLHYLRFFDLNFETIPRLIETEEYQPDSISFGLFGRAESSIAPDKFFARLHGWALEPIHWGYLVFLFISTGLLLFEHTKSAEKKNLIIFSLLLFFIHLYFVDSVVVFFSLAMWTLLISLIWFVRRINFLKDKEAYIIFLFFIIYGFIIPFGMTLIPGIELLLLEDTITNKGANWLAKIGFLSLGSSLYTLFLPSNSEVSSSHNFILSLYIKYGYFLIIPFLVFLYWLIKSFISKKSFSITSAGIMILLAHLVVVPPYMFYPSFVLFVIFIMSSMHKTT